jgi:hypothetical protein
VRKTWELNTVLPPSKSNPPIAEEHSCIYTVAVFKVPPSSCYLVSKNATMDGHQDVRGIKLLIL